jgi:hypothetical protein
MNDDFFRQIGELLGHLHFRCRSDETVSVWFDEPNGKVVFNLSSEKLYIYSLDARSLVITSYSLSTVADAIMETWRNM